MAFGLLIQIGLSVVMGLAILSLLYTFVGGYNEAVSDLRDQQTEYGTTQLAELYLNLSPGLFSVLRIIVAIVCFVAGAAIFNAVLGLIFGVLGWFSPTLVFKRLKAQRVHKVEQQLVEGLELLGNSLKSGLTLPQACELLVSEFQPPISQEFSLVLAENRLGVDFNAALSNMANRLDSNICRVLAAGVAITKRCGGDLTVIFNNIAATIREQANIEGKLDAVTAQGRFQGLILGLMPFALIIILYFVDRSHVETLFGYQLGLWAVGLVVVMVILAQVWIRKLLDIDV